MVSSRGLLVAMCCAVAAHAVAIASLSSSAPPIGRPGATVLRTVQVREIRAPAPQALLPAAAPATVKPKAPPPAVEAPIQAPGPTVRPPQAETSEAAVASAEETAPADTGALEYVPREFLSVVPAALESINVPFPESGSGDFELAVQLSLFIDETGRVQRVRIDGPPLSPALEETARQAFTNARFSPGQVEGRVVRSMIRIEVTFESRSIQAVAQAR